MLGCGDFLSEPGTPETTDSHERCSAAGASDAVQLNQRRWCGFGHQAAGPPCEWLRQSRHLCVGAADRGQITAIVGGPVGADPEPDCRDTYA